MVLGGGNKCHGCQKTVYTNEEVTQMGHKWHKTCFCCDSCKKVLALGSWIDHGGKPYCDPCYKKHHGTKGIGFGGMADTGEAAKKSAATVSAATSGTVGGGYGSSAAKPVSPRPSCADGVSKLAPSSPQPASPRPLSPRPAGSLGESKLAPSSPRPASPRPVSPRPAGGALGLSKLAPSSPQPASPRPVSPRPAGGAPGVSKLAPPSPQPGSPRPVSPGPAAAGASARPSSGALGGGNKCHACQKTVYTNEEVTQMGHKWHKTCFCCTTCNKVLVLGSWRDHAAKPYCESCHNKSFAQKGMKM